MRMQKEVTTTREIEAREIPSGTKLYYSFDIGMAHFVCLDSMSPARGAIIATSA